MIFEAHVRRALAAFAAMIVCGCGSAGDPSAPVKATAPSATTPPATVPPQTDPYSLEGLSAAPATAMLAGYRLQLSTALQNRGPLSAADPVEGSTPISGRVSVVVANGASGRVSLDSVSVSAVWLIHGNNLWPSGPFTEGNIDGDVVVEMPDGPSWGPASTVDIVALVTDGTTSSLLRAAAQPVLVTYSQVDSLLAAPYSASLAGTALTLSSSFQLRYFCWSPGPTSSQIDGSVALLTSDGSPVPQNFTVTKLWLIRGDGTAWASGVSRDTSFAGTFRFPGGPRSGFGPFDVVVSVTDGTNVVLLRAPAKAASPFYVC